MAQPLGTRSLRVEKVAGSSDPDHLHGGKTLRARVERPGLPESERVMTWAAHERVNIRRGVSTLDLDGTGDRLLL
jgi:hypothetical protein